MAKNLDVIILFDIYGNMLTQKQQDFISYYYNDDLSLEENLGLHKRLEKTRNGLAEISELIKLIDEVNRHTILSREINDATARISALTQIISE